MVNFIAIFFGMKLFSYQSISASGGGPRFTVDAATGLVRGGALAVEGLYYPKVSSSLLLYSRYKSKKVLEP